MIWCAPTFSIGAKTKASSTPQKSMHSRIWWMWSALSRPVKWVCASRMPSTLYTLGPTPRPLAVGDAPPSRLGKTRPAYPRPARGKRGAGGRRGVLG